MTSRDQATAAFVSRIATVGDGVLVGIGLAVCAATSWMRYLSIQSALRRIQDAPLVPISDLRTLLPEANDGEDGGKLVVVRGKVQPDPDSSSSGGWLGKGSDGVLISLGSGERAVIVKQTQTCIYNEWRGIFGWRFDLHAILAKSWKEQKSSSMRSVPFVLVEGTHRPNAEYIKVSLDNSSQPLPLTTVYHQLRPVQNSAYTFLQIIFGHGFPVALLDEEKILPVGKELTAVGICKLRGALEIKSVPEFPCFLSEKTKDEIEVDLSVDARILFWSGIVLGTVSFGILSYALVRNWWRWKDRRQRVRQAQEIENEDQMQENDSEEDAGEVTDGQLCVICLARRRRSAFVPCGHLVCCPRCAISVELDSSPKCPVCRQSIRSSIRIYGS